MNARLPLAALLGLVTATLAMARGTHEPLSGNWDIDATAHSTAYSAHVASRGEIVLSVDDARVESMSDDGLLYIRESKAFTTREVTVVPASKGNTEVTLWVNGSRRDSSAADLRAVQDLISMAARDFGVGAWARLVRLYENEGIDAAIRVIDPGFPVSVQVDLFTRFASGYVLTENEAITLVGATPVIATSDAARATLISLANSLASGTKVTVALLRAAVSVASSSDRRDAAVGIASARGLERESVVEMATTVQSIPASSDQREVLLYLAGHLAEDPAAVDAYLRTARSVASSSDRRDALLALTHVRVPAESFGAFFRVVESIPASSDKRDVLRTSTTAEWAGPGMVSDYLEAVRSIPASDDQRDALRALTRVAINDDDLLELYYVISEIPASADQRDAMIDTLRRKTLPVSGLSDYADACRSIPSSADAREAILALIDYAGARGGYLDDANLLHAIGRAIDALASQDDRRRCRDALAKEQQRVQATPGGIHASI